MTASPRKMCNGIGNERHSVGNIILINLAGQSVKGGAEAMLVA